MINKITMKTTVDPLILMALQEDISSEDVSTNSVVREKTSGSAQLLCKEGGTIAGIYIFSRVFQLLDSDISVETFVSDGDEVKYGQLAAVVSGDIRAILSGERTALNFLQRMSGIATYTRSMTKLLEGTATKLLDTRKTTPNMRIFEKYAVKVGGGCNHRYNLSDGVMLKDNHINAAGGITQAVAMAREYAPFIRKIEVEVENLEMLQEALDAGADIIAISDPSGTGEILGPKLFEEYTVKYNNMIWDALQKETMGKIMHICGQMKNVYPQAELIHSDVLSFDSCVSMREAREHLKKHALMGNVSTWTLEFGQPEKVEQLAVKCWRDGSNIISPACGLGTKSPLTNIQAIRHGIMEEAANV